jgi:hypothetical protein
MRLLGSGTVLVAALLSTGCIRSRGAPQTPATQASTTPGRIKRTIDKAAMRGHLHNIGQLYQVYLTDLGKPPAKPEEFLEYIKRDAPKEYQLIKDGNLVLNLKVGTDSNPIICYEKDPDLDDNRIVALRDGSVQQISTAEFDKALPPKDR